MPDPILDWHITRERMQADAAEFAFRLAEMILVCGAMVYVERKLGAPPIASAVVSAAVSIFARSRATAGMLTLLKSHGLAPRRQGLFYAIINGLTLLLFAGIVALTTKVVPLIAAVQR
jgi:hypothetical protein